MKKILLWAIVCAMLLSVLASCSDGSAGKDTTVDGTLADGTPVDGTLTNGWGGDGSTTNPGGQDGAEESFTLPSWMTGSDAAKLLLAQERLNTKLLQNDGNIFENGTEVMDELASNATRNLNASFSSTPRVQPLASFRNTSEVLSGPDCRGKLSRDGETFIFSDFTEYNNSYEYFENITQNIVSSAEAASHLIDTIKKNVRVLDKWVNMNGGTYLYLSVQENSELLIQQILLDDFNQTQVVRRYRNEEGRDVYEMYTTQNDKEYQTRMFYIPGERYEYTNCYKNVRPLAFVADHSKGYWETCVMQVESPNHYLSYFTMKDDLCYDAIYDINMGGVALIKVMSSDRATDIFHVSAGDTQLALTLRLNAFNGIKNVTAHASDVSYMEQEGYANTTGFATVTVNMENGKTLKVDEYYCDKSVWVNAIHVGYYAGDVYSADMNIVVYGDTLEEQYDSFRTFLEEMGMVCRRDLDSVLDGIMAAYRDVDDVADYYRWNGEPNSTEEGILRGYELEMERMAEMERYYLDVKDAPVVLIEDMRAMELNISFAPIVDSAMDVTRGEALNVVVSHISLTIDDTRLFVAGESYHVGFGLLDEAGGIIHFETENPAAVPYGGEERFTVSASDVILTLPTPAPGNYTPVAYVATSEGIRASACLPLTAAEAEAVTLAVENKDVTVSGGNEGTIVLSVVLKTDFTETVEMTGPVTYQEALEYVSTVVFAFGIPGDALEMETEEGFVPIEDPEALLESGVYRISYTVENGEHSKDGYVLFDLTVN